MQACNDLIAIFYENFLFCFSQAIATMCGLCFFGTIDLTQHGIQSVQGAIFVIIAENTFGPMYSVLALFPHDLPLFVRERTAGNYNTVQYYIAHIVALVRHSVDLMKIFILNL